MWPLPPPHTQTKLPSLPGCATPSIFPALGPVHRLSPLPRTPLSFSLGLSLDPSWVCPFSQCCPGPAGWVRRLLQAPPGASSISSRSPGSPLPFRNTRPCLAPSGHQQALHLSSCFPYPPPRPLSAPLSRFQCTGQAGKVAFLTVGPRAGVRTFWFLPAPSGPDSGRTPGCTCTRTSSQALEAAPCPLYPGAAGSPHGSWGV